MDWCVCVILWHLPDTLEDVATVEWSDWPSRMSKMESRKNNMARLMRQILSLFVKKWYTIKLDCYCCPFTCKRPRCHIHFPSIILLSRWKHGIIFGGWMEKTRVWTTFIACVWVATAPLNQVWNFWLQHQHTYVFSRFLFNQCGKLVTAGSQQK